jgi:hypothetical protein
MRFTVDHPNAGKYDFIEMMMLCFSRSETRFWVFGKEGC